MFPALGAGPVSQWLRGGGGGGTIELVYTIRYIFYIPPSRNVLPVNITDSMITRESMVLGCEGVANISAKG
jgi:hypothetical protein